MPKTDAQKRATAKWNKGNTKNAACTLSLSEHAAFKAYAEARGKTISGLLLDYVRSCIAEGMEQRDGLEHMETAEHGKSAETSTDLQ